MRARFCRHCGSTNLRRVKVGVTTLARDVAAQLGRPVSEVTASLDPTSTLERVVVGTEATWQRVRRGGVVIFVDFDQYLLAPRESARRSAITAVGKAGRLVGSRREGRGHVVIQTRRGDDGVLEALREASFDAIIEGDVATAELLGLAPYGASAEVSGEGAEAFVNELRSELVRVIPTPNGFVVRAKDVATLTTVLRSAPRPQENCASPSNSYSALALETGSRGGLIRRVVRRGRETTSSVPNSTTSEGTRSARMTVASRRIPMPRPVARILTSVSGADARLINAKNKMRAALVTSRPVRPRPSTRAPRVSCRRRTLRALE